MVESLLRGKENVKSRGFLPSSMHEIHSHFALNLVVSFLTE